MITFPEMRYERPDAEQLKEQWKGLTERLKAAATYEGICVLCDPDQHGYEAVGV